MDDRGGVEIEGDRFEPTGALDERTAGTVDHHLGDGGVGQQRLERAEAGDLVGELFEQRVEARRREERLLLTEEITQRAAQGVGVQSSASSTPCVTRRW